MEERDMDLELNLCDLIYTGVLQYVGKSFTRRQ